MLSLSQLLLVFVFSFSHLVFADNLEILHQECFAKNLGRSCVRLGTTLWQDPNKRIEAKAAFNQGCDLKIESACALKDLKSPPGEPASAPVPKSASTDNNKGITKQDATHYTVSRSVALAYASDLSTTLSSATMEADYGPDKKKKQIRGYRFTEIAPASVFLKLGFQTGDILTHANEQPLTSPSEATAMIPGLAFENHITVKLRRENKIVLMEYHLVD